MAVSDLNWTTMTQKDWKQDPIGKYQGSKNTCFRPKIDHERSKKNADEVEKSLTSALIMAVLDLNWTTWWPKRIENEIQSVYIKGLKIHVSDTKMIIKDPKKCRGSWKIIKFCSHNGSFRSELSKIMTQKDWKQDPIGINQGSKNRCLRDKIDHERSKKNADDFGKSLNFALIMGSFRSELSKIMTQNNWQQYPIGMYQGSKHYMFKT